MIGGCGCGWGGSGSQGRVGEEGEGVGRQTSKTKWRVFLCRRCVRKGTRFVNETSLIGRPSTQAQALPPLEPPHTHPAHTHTHHTPSLSSPSVTHVPEEKSSGCHARSSHVAWPPGSRAGNTSCWCRWGRGRPSCLMPEGEASCGWVERGWGWGEGLSQGVNAILCE